MSQLSTPFSNAQLELLKLFSSNLSEIELENLKRLLLEFKFQKVTNLADKVWEENEWDDKKVNEILNSHLRTPYNSQNEDEKK